MIRSHAVASTFPHKMDTHDQLLTHFTTVVELPIPFASSDEQQLCQVRLVVVVLERRLVVH